MFRPIARILRTHIIEVAPVSRSTSRQPRTRCAWAWRSRGGVGLEGLESRQLLTVSTDLSAILAQPAVELAPLANSSTPFGLSPAQVRHAYGVDAVTFNGGVVGDGSGQTIAIVVAYDNPNIVSDLNTFSQTYGLPNPPSFTIARAAGLSQVDPGWSLETALDVQWAHAIAPRANILLVEARSASLSDLLGAVNYARNQSGVVAVSMSWGSSEFSTESYYDSYFRTPTNHIGGSGLRGGVTFVAASGDDGAWSGALWPSVSSNVLAVGGTSLSSTASGGYVGEAAWNGSGGGYSDYIARPSFQSGVQSSPARTTPDVAFNADPTSGFSVYSSVAYAGQTGWFAVGGTSAGTPQWAALVAIADQGLALAGKGSLSDTQSLVYSLNTADFHDVTSGSNGYYAKLGYDLATGLGSPRANLVIRDLLALNGVTSAAPIYTPPSNPNAFSFAPTRTKAAAHAAITTTTADASRDPVPIAQAVVAIVATPAQSIATSAASITPPSLSDLTGTHTAVVNVGRDLPLLEAPRQLRNQGRDPESNSWPSDDVGATLAIGAFPTAFLGNVVTEFAPADVPALDPSPQLPPRVTPEIWDQLFESGPPLFDEDSAEPIRLPTAAREAEAEQGLPRMAVAVTAILAGAALARLFEDEADAGGFPALRV